MLSDFADSDYVDEKCYRDPAKDKRRDKNKVVSSFKRRTGEYQNVELDENGFPIRSATIVSEKTIEVKKSTHRRPQRSLDERRREEKGTHRSNSKESRRLHEEAFEVEG